MTSAANSHAETDSVAVALEAYLSANGFTLADYDAETFVLMAFGRCWRLPNTAHRKWAVPLHDLHHVATGFGTDFVGEAEIGAWELGAGCRTPVVYLLNVGAVTAGVFIAPQRVLRAAAAGLRSQTLYRTGLSREAALRLSVAELRAHLRIPTEGLATQVARHHELAPPHTTGHEPQAGDEHRVPALLLALTCLQSAVLFVGACAGVVSGAMGAGLAGEGGGRALLLGALALGSLLSGSGAVGLALGQPESVTRSRWGAAVLVAVALGSSVLLAPGVERLGAVAAVALPLLVAGWGVKRVFGRRMGGVAGV